MAGDCGDYPQGCDHGESVVVQFLQAPTCVLRLVYLKIMCKCCSAIKSVHLQC